MASSWASITDDESPTPSGSRFIVSEPDVSHEDVLIANDNPTAHIAKAVKAVESADHESAHPESAGMGEPRRGRTAGD